MSERIRFGVAVDEVSGLAELRDIASFAEESGFDILLVPDHLTTMSPEVALTGAAAVTERLRVGSAVFNNDLRHPLLLAQQAATIDLFSGGRFELGLGAGWNGPEYEAMGIPMDRASVRIARMEESAEILRRLFSGEKVDFDGEHYSIRAHTVVPTPPQGARLPIHIGGNGDKLLAAAARRADVVGVSPYSITASKLVPSHFGTEAVAERIEHVRRNAGPRFEQVEINVPVQKVEVTDRSDALERLVQRMRERFGDDAPDRHSLASSPYVLVGSPEQVAQQVSRHRSELGIGFFAAWWPAARQLAPVIRELFG